MRKRTKPSSNDSIDKLPLPTFSAGLAEDTLIKAKQIFYRRDVRLAAWYLRAQYQLPAIPASEISEEEHKRLAEIYHDPKFHLQYKALMSILPIDTYRRWEPCFREFLFFNHVGDVLPAQGATDTTGSFEITEGVDIYGEYVSIRIYNSIDGTQWKDIQRHADKRLRRMAKWKSKGHDPELLVRLAGMRRMMPSLTYSELAGQLMTKYPELAVKEKGYTDTDISKMVTIAQKLHF